MSNNISPLFRGFKFCNFRLQDAKWNRSLCKIPSFKIPHSTKMIPGLMILKIILIYSLCDKCPYTQRKYVFFLPNYVWNIKHNLYIVSSNWVTKVNNQKVNLISYVCNIQRLSYTWLEWSRCLSRCIKGFLRQPKISIFCWHSDVSMWI